MNVTEGSSAGRPAELTSPTTSGLRSLPRCVQQGLDKLLPPHKAGDGASDCQRSMRVEADGHGLQLGHISIVVYTVDL